MAGQIKHALIGLVGRNIKRLREQHGMTLEDLSAKMGNGIDTGSLSRLERGLQGYSPQTLEAASRAFGVNVTELFTEQPEAPYDVEQADTPVASQNIPVVQTAQPGDDGVWLNREPTTDVVEGYVSYPSKDARSYAVRVKGDGMRPRIKPGEFIIVEPATEVAPGDEVFVRLRDGRYMLRVFGSRRHGMIELHAINGAQKTITLDESEIETMHYIAGIAKPSLFSDQE